MVIFLVSIDKLSGKIVIGTGGYILGEVKGAEFNTSTWQVTHLQVKLFKPGIRGTWIQEKI